MSRRGAIAVIVLAAWAAGLAAFARREMVQAPARKLAEAGLRVAPGALYYIVRQNGHQIGYASSTIDTVIGGLKVTDFLLADLPIGARTHRTAAQTVARLTRSLALTDFSIAFDSDSTQFGVRGRVRADTLLEWTVSHGTQVVDSQRVRLSQPLLLPTLLPLVVALGERPTIGRRYDLSSFDPLAMTPKVAHVRVLAESLFVVADSARFDTTDDAWRVAHRDTVRAWLLASDSAATGVRAWVDEQGRIVATPQLLGFELTRTAFELAFEQWRRDRAKDERPGVAKARPSRDDDVLETTAIAASRPLGGRRIDHLRMRLAGVSLLGFDLEGDGQSLRGDTLIVDRTSLPARSTYALPGGVANDRRVDRDSSLRLARAFAPFLAAEPLLQIRDPAIIALKQRLWASERDPRIVAERIARWVHDSLAKRVTVSVPSALQVLESRSGDCNEHTQLFIALARAANIPSRPVAGLAFIDGKFYYHVWPEVWLGRWVAVDPTFGQFPADAAHLRFVRGGLARQTELLRLMGQLRIDVLSS